MRALVCCLLAVIGCGTVAPRAPGPHAAPVAPDPPPWFTEIRSAADLDAAPGHALLRSLTPANLVAAAGPPSALAPLGAPPERVAVLVHRGEQVQVAVPAAGAVLALWVPTSSLSDTVIRAAPLWPSELATGAASAIVRPGTPVTIIERRDERTRVTVTERGAPGSGYADVAWLDGWVRTADLGLVFAHRPRSSTPPTRPVWSIEPLRVAPDHAAPIVATLGFAGPYRVTGEVAGWFGVAYEGPTFSATGYVTAVTGAPPPPLLVATSPDLNDLLPGLVDVGQPVRVPPGTCLRASPTGTIVAITTEALAIGMHPELDRWWSRAIASRWGTFEVGLLRPDDGVIDPVASCASASRIPPVTRATGGPRPSRATSTRGR